MENKTGNISNSSSDISESEINEYKDKPYEELKQRKYMVKNRDGSLRGQMSSSSTNYRGADREKPQSPLYDPTTPNCHRGMWAPLRIAGPTSKNKESLYFKWCLPISGQSHALGFVDGYDDGFHGYAECKRNLDYYGMFAGEYEDFTSTGTRQGEGKEGIELQ
ncbi:hypothetical protein RHMOL_Rhmol04G0266000 [Rhododendron molle]|uniref:Uncharacterized protein n=1 Tax=Rhododendron molle TaxID=49168 RepID=A0ACC0P505_RHOML|nr:hypothetical protein RHMOL_Rhmol04G0266000 [Rhododendron molle]